MQIKFVFKFFVVTYFLAFAHTAFGKAVFVEESHISAESAEKICAQDKITCKYGIVVISKNGADDSLSKEVDVLTGFQAFSGGGDDESCKSVCNHLNGQEYTGCWADCMGFGPNSLLSF